MLILRICKHASLIAEFTFPYSPVGKSSWFNVRESFKSLSTLLEMGRGESSKRLPASFPQHFWLLVLIIFPHSCKISRPYLVTVLSYWTWAKTTPQKNRLSWSNPYNTWVLLVPWIEIITSETLFKIKSSF